MSHLLPIDCIDYPFRCPEDSELRDRLSLCRKTITRSICSTGAGLRLCKTGRPPGSDLTGKPFGLPEMMKGMQEMAAFEDDVTQELIPFVDSHLRTVADRDHRAMTGLSLGAISPPGSCRDGALPVRHEHGESTFT
jgi:Putative esterase